MTGQIAMRVQLSLAGALGGALIWAAIKAAERDWIGQYASLVLFGLLATLFGAILGMAGPLGLAKALPRAAGLAAVAVLGRVGAWSHGDAAPGFGVPGDGPAHLAATGTAFGTIALSASLSARHYAFGRGEYKEAVAVAHGADIAHAHVGAARELGEALDAGNDRATVFVRERDIERVVLFIRRAHVPLFRKNVGDGELHFREWHGYGSLPDAGSVLYAYEQVCNRVVYHTINLRRA